MKKGYIGWLFACIVLSVLLIISIILGMTGFFSSITYLTLNSDLSVGESVVLAVEPNEASVASFTFDGSYLPGENLPMVLQINAANLSTDVRLRVKTVVFGLEETVPFEFITTAHFEKQEDGYYYYDEVLQGGNKITFCNYIIIPEDSNFVSGEKYVLTIVAETLETKFDQNIWKIVQ